MIDFANLKYLEIPEGEVVEVKRGDEILWNKPIDKPYTELLYLEFSGTQHVDTGVNALELTSFDLSFIPSTESTVAYQVYISSLSNGTFTFAQTISDAENCFLRYGGNKTIFATGKISPSAINRAYIDESRNFIVNETRIGTVTLDTLGTVSENVYIAHSSIPSRDGKFRFFGLKLYTDALARDFIPALDANNVPCLYDKVSNEFFYNVGKGNFLYAEIIDNEYESIEYLESTGKEFIDTEMIISTSTDTVECVYQSIEDVKYKWIFGEHDTNARFGVGTGDGSGQRNVAYGTGTVKVGDSYIFNNPHTFLADTSGVYIDGNKITSYKAFSSTSTIYLFNLNLNGNDYCNKARIYSYKHWRDGALMRDMIPVKRLLDGEAGLYDKANKVFYPLFSTFNLRREKTEEEMYQMWIEDIGHEEEIL